MLKSFQQHIDNIEVIFVHDSKTPLSIEQIQQLRLTGENGRYIHGEFNSPGLARNRGIEEAKGEWIVFWDSDDFGHHAIISSLVSIRSSQVFIANFNVLRSDELHSKSQKYSKISFSQIAVNPGLWRFIFEYKVIANCRFRRLKLGEDILFLIESGVLEGEMTLVQETIYEYHVSPLQSTNKGNMKLEPNMEQFIEELIDVIKLNQPNSKLTYAIYWRQIFSILKISKGKQLLFCVLRTFSLIRSLNPHRKIAFFRGLRLALGRGLV